MADGSCSGVSSGTSTRAYSSLDDNACVDEKTRREIEAKQAEEARRRKDAEAEARAAAHYSNGSSCTKATPVDAGSCRAEAPARQSVAPAATPHPSATPSAAETKRAADDRARVDAIVRSNETFDTRTKIEQEIVRLRAIAPAKDDLSLQGAIRARIGWLTANWAALSRKAGDNPPTASFNPYTASGDELHNALMWTSLVGVIPHEALAFDGGVQFKEDVLEAVALRTPGLGEEVLASYASEPANQRMLLERELRRLGDRSECRPDETNDQLMARRTRLLLNKQVEDGEAAQREHQIGLDGKQGTARALVEYEIEQRLIAMNPGTTLGGIAAGAAAMNGKSTEEIRAAGEAGNNIEGIGGGLAGIDPRAVRNQGQMRPTMSGRRRPPGPGLGRRRRAVASNRPNARTDLPSAINDGHILHGDIRDNGSAGGFHHEAPGTQEHARIVRGTRTKPNALGVYRAEVEVKDRATGEWVRKGPASTFFPRHWTRTEVRTAVLHAFQHRTDLGDGLWEGRLPNGMIIRGVVRDGRIITAHPRLPTDD